MSKKETKPKDFSKLSKEELIEKAKRKYHFYTDKYIVNIVKNDIINFKEKRSKTYAEILHEDLTRLEKIRKELRSSEILKKHFSLEIFDMKALFNEGNELYNEWEEKEKEKEKTLKKREELQKQHEEERREKKTEKSNEMREIAIKNVKDAYKYGTSEWIGNICNKFISNYKPGWSRESMHQLNELIKDVEEAIIDLQDENKLGLTKGAFDSWIKELKDIKKKLQALGRNTETKHKEKTETKHKEKTETKHKEKTEHKTETEQKEKPEIPKNYLSNIGFIRLRPRDVSIIKATNWLKGEINNHNLSDIDGREIQTSIVTNLESLLKNLSKYKQDERYEKYKRALTKELDNARSFLNDLYNPRDGIRFNNLLDSEKHKPTTKIPKCATRKTKEYDPDFKVEKLNCFELTYNLKNGKTATKYIHYDPKRPIKDIKLPGENITSIMKKFKINRF